MPSRTGRWDAVTLGILGLIALGIPLGLVGTAGAIGIPTDDDWVYMRAAENLFHTGALDMPGHTAASIGQIFMVQPLLWLSGGDRLAFTVFGLVLGLLGIASTYLLSRQFVGMGTAALVVLVLEAFPGFGRATASFMTDVPAFSLSWSVCCLGSGGCRSGISCDFHRVGGGWAACLASGNSRSPRQCRF